MEQSDLPIIHELSNRIYLGRYHEELVIFEEKFRLFPQGCFALEYDSSEIIGYCFSHPWMLEIPPALNTLLGTLPINASTYFIHDLAIAEAYRGNGLATLLLRVVSTIAKINRLRHVTLIAVNGSWPAPGSEDTELGVLMEPEVGHGATEVYPGVQA